MGPGPSNPLFEASLCALSFARTITAVRSTV